MLNIPSPLLLNHNFPLVLRHNPTQNIDECHSQGSQGQEHQVSLCSRDTLFWPSGRSTTSKRGTCSTEITVSFSRRTVLSTYCEGVICQYYCSSFVEGYWTEQPDPFLLNNRYSVKSNWRLSRPCHSCASWMHYVGIKPSERIQTTTVKLNKEGMLPQHGLNSEWTRPAWFFAIVLQEC